MTSSSDTLSSDEPVAASGSAFFTTTGTPRGEARLRPSHARRAPSDRTRIYGVENTRHGSAQRQTSSALARSCWRDPRNHSSSRGVPPAFNRGNRTCAQIRCGVFRRGCLFVFSATVDLILIGYALDNPIRVALLEALGDREVTLSDVARAFAISRPTAYRHIAMLAHAGLILTARRGRWRVLRRVSASWELLERLRAVASARGPGRHAEHSS
jgi:DNA-binding transcriptional ArsR family regulator